MRVSELKNLTSDVKLKRLLCSFWDYPSSSSSEDHSPHIFRAVLTQTKADESIESVFEIITKTFFDNPVLFSDKNLLSDLKRASARIYGDSYFFARGTFLEAEHIARLAKKEERDQKVESLSFLYDVLGAKRLEKKHYDVVYNLAISELYPAIIENKDKILENKSVLFDLACDHILPKIGTDDAKYNDQRILGMLSVLLFGDRQYWIQANHIDPDLLLLTTHKTG